MRPTAFTATWSPVTPGYCVSVPPVLCPQAAQEDGLLAFPSWRKPCIVVLPLTRLPHLLASAGPNEFSERHECVQEVVFGLAGQLTVEADGRTELPADWLDHISADRQVLIAGVPSIFRIWGIHAPNEVKILISEDQASS